MIKLEEQINDTILEEVGKEDKSDDEEEILKTTNSNSNNIKKSDKSSDESNKEKLEIINNLVDNIFSSHKIISIKEEILQQIQFILLLIDIKNGEEPSFHDLRDAKANIRFYNSLNNLIKKKNKKFILRRKRFTQNYLNLSRETMSSRSQINNKKEFLKKGYFCITDWKDEEIGEKLTQVSKSLLNKITSKEIYRGVFLKKDKDIKSPNIVECINSFNRLTSFIIEDVLSYDSPKERAKIYEKWVQVADYCKNKKNYNDCIAIYSALNNYIITGLKLTLKNVSSKTKSLYAQISNFCSCEGNYKNVRDDMDLCERKGIIFIPYLGMLLRDINFYEESSKYINEYGCINMGKIEIINSIMEKYFRYKTNEKKINKKNNINIVPELNFFEKLEDIEEGDLEKLADKIEPVFKFDSQKNKRLTNIDKKYFLKYAEKFKKRNTMTPSMIQNMRNTISPGIQYYGPLFS